MSKRLTIGISCPEIGRYTVFYSAVMRLQPPPDVEVIMVHARSAVISENRNHITEAALSQKADYVLYLDDDHMLPFDTYQKLIAADKDVISAHYTQRQPPFNPVILNELPTGDFFWKQLHPKEQGIIEVDAVGAGCLLVKSEVLKALKPPYWTLGQVGAASWGDDLDFCRRVRKAGFKIHCDLDNTIGHIITGAVWPQRDENQGWLANYCHDPGLPNAIARWPMPLPGDI